jgi:hypothetical protein
MKTIKRIAAAIAPVLVLAAALAGRYGLPG